MRKFPWRTTPYNDEAPCIEQRGFVLLRGIRWVLVTL